MSAAPTRRVLVLALASAPALNAAAIAAPELRGDDTERLPDHAGFWARMPLPFGMIAGEAVALAILCGGGAAFAQFGRLF